MKRKILCDGFQRSLPWECSQELECVKLTVLMHEYVVPDVMDKLMAIPQFKDYFYGQVKSKVMKQSQGLYPAPLKIIEVSHKAYTQLHSES